MTKIIKLVEEKQMCSLPWVHAYLSFHNDSIKPCCHYRNEVGKISNGLTKEWFNSSSNDLRENWIQNMPPQNCVACDVDAQSFSYKKWKNFSYSKNFTFLETVDIEYPQLPSVFHINLKNTCNLSCRMCSPVNSSKIFQLVKRVPELEQYLHQTMPSKKINIDLLNGSFKNAEIVLFTGGEPMLDDDILSIINMMKNESRNLSSVSVTTNMTVINNDILMALDSLDARIDISISIDGPSHIQEYIRHGIKWKEMIENFIYIQQKFPKFKFSVNTTVSILTVGYLTDTIEVIKELQKELNIKFEWLMTSPVTDKKFLHPGILPDIVKKNYINKIESYMNSESISGCQKLLNTALEMLSSKIDCEIGSFVDYINKFDSAAKTDILEVYPEFESIFK